MKKSTLLVGVAAFAVTAAVLLLLVGCEDAASPNNNELVDGFLVRVNEKPGNNPGTGMTIRAVTVSSEGSGASGSGNYVVGQTVFINAGTTPEGFARFEKWTANINGVTFEDVNKASTSFIMPANNVTVTAVFWKFSDWGNFTDARDQKKYKTTTIGGKMWMAENLNYDMDGSRCYKEQADNCVKYGRLYNWDAAMNACPAGWHLPSRVEWEILVKFVGGQKHKDYDEGRPCWLLAGQKLKAISPNWDGTDDYGFSALPGGYMSNMFLGIGGEGDWWTATEGDYGERAHVYYMTNRNASVGLEGYDVHESDWGKVAEISVRCVKND